MDESGGAAARMEVAGDFGQGDADDGGTRGIGEDGSNLSDGIALALSADGGRGDCGDKDLSRGVASLSS